MNAFELFNAIRCGDRKTVNQEYGRIRRREHDRFLGSEMIRNTLDDNAVRWASLDKAAWKLFLELEKNITLKREIQKRAGVSDRELADSRYMPVQPVIHVADDLIETALSHYRRAYESANNPEYLDSFCSEALKYRLTSGVIEADLDFLSQIMDSLTAAVGLENYSMEYLWNAYQRNPSAMIRDVILSGLRNQLWIGGKCYFTSYTQIAAGINQKTDKIRRVI